MKLLQSPDLRAAAYKTYQPTCVSQVCTGSNELASLHSTPTLPRTGFTPPPTLFTFQRCSKGQLKPQHPHTTPPNNEKLLAN